MPAIELDGLRKVFGETVAVDHISLRVPRGEVFGFLGPNGAGKTTTVNMLLDLVHPTNGRAEVLGGSPGAPEVMARVGFLPEHFRFQPWLTARELLDVHGRLHRMPDAERRDRADAVLERVGLADWAHTRIAKFSKGMMQRVGLAVALLSEPELVFLDEPTSALDPLGRREVRDIIHDLKQTGVTVFLNSHLLSEVEVTCDRVAIVKEGRVVAIGSLEELTGPGIEVEVKAAGLSEEIRQGIARYGRVLRDEDGRLLVAVETEDTLPALAEWLVAEGARLYRFSPRRLSLEELFVRTIDEGEPHC